MKENRMGACSMTKKARTQRLKICWVYVLKCRDGSLYTGWTNDLEKRVRSHQAGKGGKYTRSRLPVRLAMAWKKKSPREARREEVCFKQLTREEKMKRVSAGKKNRSARVRPRADPAGPV